MSEVTDERLINLEIKQSFLERNIEELDGVVRSLNLEVQRLHREIERLQHQSTEEAPGLLRSIRLEDEVPPHY